MAVSHAAQTVVSNGSSKDANSQFDSIPDCIEAFANGQFLIVLDSPTRENEGDLIIAATHLTPSKAAFMIRYTSGYLCVPLSAERAKSLQLEPMVPADRNQDPNRTAYAITVDAEGGVLGRGETGQPNGTKGEGYGTVTTGISAHDRSITCRVLADPRATSTDLRRPGHIVPLFARPGGVRARRGHTEAGWEFARLAGISPEVAVIGEMVVDGEPEAVAEGSGSGGWNMMPELQGSGMMRMKECLEFGRRWGIRCCTIDDLVAYVEEKEGKLGNGA